MMLSHRRLSRRNKEVREELIELPLGVQSSHNLPPLSGCDTDHLMVIAPQLPQLGSNDIIAQSRLDLTC